MGKNLPFQTIRPLFPRLEYLLDYGPIFVQAALFLEKKWYYSTNLQAIGFLVLIQYFCWHGILLFSKYYSEIETRDQPQSWR